MWHMHDECVNECDVNPFNFKTSAQMQKERESRNQFLKKLHGISVINVWECEILEEATKNEKLSSFIKRKIDTYLQPRSAFLGGRVDIFQRNYECSSDEVINLADVVRYCIPYQAPVLNPISFSLYPWVNSSCEYPIGVPTIEMFPKDWKNLDKIGLYQAQLLAPKHEFVPVLGKKAPDGR